jgi:hypothetical protein
MRFVQIVVGASMLVFPGIAQAQGADCNELARDLVVKNYQSSYSDYSKLLFLSTLTQMDVKSSGEALSHSGEVAIGPLKVGPGTWSKQKQDQLRSELRKVLNIEELKQSAAAVSLSSGDQSTAKVVIDCLNAGGLFVALNDLGTDNAVAALKWASYPGSKTSAIIESVYVVNGKFVGGTEWTKKGAKLNDRLTQRITIRRDDPKKDLAVVVNTSNAGSAIAYLPPSILPPAPPPKMMKAAIEGDKITVCSGGPCVCQGQNMETCVKPQHGGVIVLKSGRPKIFAQGGKSGVVQDKEKETPQEYCVTFWASTSACEARDYITGAASAIEEYPER